MKKRTNQRQNTIVKKMRALVVFLTAALFQTASIIPIEAQRIAAIKPFTPTIGRTAEVARSGIAAGVKISRLPRQSVTTAFNAAGRSAVTHQSVTTALRSSGIRRRAVNSATGSLTRTPRIAPVVPQMPAITSGTQAVGRTAAQISSKQAFKDAHDIRKLLSPNLSPRAKLEIGKSASEATNRAAAVQALEKQAVTVEKLFNAKARLHKNSRFFRGPSHVYVIVGKDGRIYKVGESSNKILSNGLSGRAQTQVQKLGDGYRSRVIATFGSKAEAKVYERNMILRYEAKYKDRRFVLPGNHERFRRHENKSEDKQ
ncbi:MAG TPA: hypothetical protein VF571_15870 [Pyrinomonadaceae bacterium]|jgi:hypothetical protein